MTRNIARQAPERDIAPESFASAKWYDLRRWIHGYSLSLFQQMGLIDDSLLPDTTTTIRSSLLCSCLFGMLVTQRCLRGRGLRLPGRRAPQALRAGFLFAAVEQVGREDAERSCRHRPDWIAFCIALMPPWRKVLRVA